MLLAIVLSIQPRWWHLLMKLLGLKAGPLEEWTGLKCKGCHRC